MHAGPKTSHLAALLPHCPILAHPEPVEGVPRAADTWEITRMVTQPGLSRAAAERVREHLTVALIEYARMNHVDQVLIGARASSSLRRFLGSVSSQVVAEASCTVTVVRVPQGGEALEIAEEPMIADA